ncbi:hypothetical protein SADUNF_Sadunf09G0090700 [Salix dunnii]|uniref:Uncharacterized protein n=1 Tax=Salix dunnii TaxID=1413687 RepID=A0A835MWF8_9ROSI|nr:hypothetical protein SADUNF_Sadunf09G0090700 [Salix dunnii]
MMTMKNTNISTMKASLIIVCILLASIVFSPSATCTARRALAGKDPYPFGHGPASSAPPCGGSKTSCNPKSQPGQRKPKKKCDNSPRQSDDCEAMMTMKNTNISTMKASLIIVCILLASIVFSPSATCTARRALAGKDPYPFGHGPASSAPPCGGSKTSCNPKSQPGQRKPKKKCDNSPRQSDDCG